MPSCREKPALATSERDRLRADFVRRAGWGDAGERLLAGDASFRKYFRLSRPRESASQASSACAKRSGRRNASAFS